MKERTIYADRFNIAEEEKPEDVKVGQQKLAKFLLTKKKMWKKQGLKDLRNNIKQSDVHVIGIPEQEERDNRQKTYLKNEEPEFF